MSDGNGCLSVRELLVELAAGVASGEERAEALRHLARCPACRRELDEIVTLTDELLLLAPRREPPAGFESSVLERLQPRRRGSARTKGALLLAASLGLVALLGAGTVLWATAGDRDLAARYRRTLSIADGRYFAAATLTSRGQEAGHLFAYEGAPSWVFVTIEAAVEPGRYEVQLTTESGEQLDIGRCRIENGRGSWGTSIDVPVGDILLVRLVRPGEPSIVARLH